MHQKLFQFFLRQEVGAFRNNRKGTAKATPRIGKKCIYIYRKYLLCLQSNASGSFFAKMYGFCRTKTQIFSF